MKINIRKEILKNTRIRVKLIVEDDKNSIFPSEVFVYDNSDDEYLQVADIRYLKGSPTIEEIRELESFYRSNKVTLIFDDLKEAEVGIKEVINDIQELKKNILKEYSIFSGKSTFSEKDRIKETDKILI